MDREERRLIAYEIHSQEDMPIEVPPVERDWMDESINRFAYRCLPLAIANRAGWIIRNPSTFTAIWNGGLTKNDTTVRFGPPKDPFYTYETYTASTVKPEAEVRVELPKPPDPRISSHFGSGVVTFSIPFLFRTPKGINLWVKGPSNYVKDGAHPLEGIVETDWVASTFTMNWKLTRPRQPVVFRAGDPICMLVPIPRGLAEGFDPVRLPIGSDPAFQAEYLEWEQSRTQFMTGLEKPGSDEHKRGWQKHYFKGENLSGGAAEGHQTKVNLKEFRRGPRGEEE